MPESESEDSIVCRKGKWCYLKGKYCRSRPAGCLKVNMLRVVESESDLDIVESESQRCICQTIQTEQDNCVVTKMMTIGA